MEDQLIVRLFFERSENAIAELEKKYGNLCRSISCNILKNEQDAEECVSDTYLAVWNTIPPEKPDLLSAYVCKIVRNLSIKKYDFNTAQKRNSYYDVALEEFEECLMGKGNVEDEILAQEMSAKVNQFLDGMKKRNRMIFIQRYWFGDSIEEIARKFGMNINSVKVNLHRTRANLKEFLKAEDLT